MGLKKFSPHPPGGLATARTAASSAGRQGSPPSFFRVFEPARGNAQACRSPHSPPPSFASSFRLAVAMATHDRLG